MSFMILISSIVSPFPVVIVVASMIVFYLLGHESQEENGEFRKFSENFKSLGNSKLCHFPELLDTKVEIW